MVVSDGVFQAASLFAAESERDFASVILDPVHKLDLDSIDFGVPGDVNGLPHDRRAKAVPPVLWVYDNADLRVV